MLSQDERTELDHLRAVIQAVREVPPYCLLGMADGHHPVTRVRDLLRAMGLCAAQEAGSGHVCELSPHEPGTRHCGGHVTWPCAREPEDPPYLPVPPYRQVSEAEMSAIRSRPLPGPANGKPSC